MLHSTYTLQPRSIKEKITCTLFLLYMCTHTLVCTHGEQRIEPPPPPTPAPTLPKSPSLEMLFSCDKLNCPDAVNVTLKSSYRLVPLSLPFLQPLDLGSDSEAWQDECHLMSDEERKEVSVYFSCKRGKSNRHEVLTVSLLTEVYISSRVS